MRRPGRRLPDDEAGRARHRAAEDHRRDGGDPAAGPARQQGHERLLHRPGDQRRHAARRSPRRTRPWSSGWSSWRRSRPSWPSPTEPPDVGLWDALRGRRTTVRPEPRRAVRGAERGDHAADRHRPRPDRRPARSASGPRKGRRSARLQADVVELLDADPEAPDVEVQHRRLRLHLADRGPGRHRPTSRASAPTCTPSTPPWRSRGSGPACCARWSRSATPAGARAGLVYLYKRGTFYPFAPSGRAAARQPARDPGPRRPRRGAPDREGPAALAGGLGRAWAVSPQSRCDLPGRSSIRWSATRACCSVSGSTWIWLTTTPADQGLHRPDEVRQVDPVHRRAVADGPVEERDVLVRVQVGQPLDQVELGADRPARPGGRGLDRLDDELGRADQVGLEDHLVLALGVHQDLDVGDAWRAARRRRRGRSGRAPSSGPSTGSSARCAAAPR